ncbi:MAG TPA: PH domain-containing protein [Pseudolabrys sp.]|jgi:uncharacterized membrane protein YdbT with pleckstrin-like domain|nr:PH domain-containing protein [Pseudolabrys sp.]
MRYIDEILQPGETLAYSGRLHWIVYVPAAFLLLLALAALTRVDNSTGWLWLSIAGLLAAAGGIMLFKAWFHRWTTEIDVTDRRVVYKHGFINRHTVEMNMDKVESVDVDQSILGRLLDYGDITIRGTGETWETLKMIGAPLKFRNHVTAR